MEINEMLEQLSEGERSEVRAIIGKMLKNNKKYSWAEADVMGRIELDSESILPVKAFRASVGQKIIGIILRKNNIRKERIFKDGKQAWYWVGIRLKNSLK